MPVKDIDRPTEELVSAGEETPIRDLCQLMYEWNVRHVVTETTGNLAGIVTDRDVATAFGGGAPSTSGLPETPRTRIRTTVIANEGVFDLGATMADHGVRRLPVVDGDELIGIVTLDDLVIPIEDELRDLTDVIRSEPPPYETV